MKKEVFIENILKKYDKAKFNSKIDNLSKKYDKNNVSKSDNSKASVFAYSILEDKIIEFELIIGNVTCTGKGVNVTCQAVALDKDYTINKPLIFIKDWFSEKGEIKKQLKHEIGATIKSFEELAEQSFEYAHALELLYKLED